MHTPTPTRPQSPVHTQPRIPWELIYEVIQQCDRSTLVVLCGIVLGTLELAGPLLYRDVEIQSFEAFELLFCEPSEINHDSRILPFLGLHLLRTLSLSVNLNSRSPPSFEKLLRLPLRRLDDWRLDGWDDKKEIQKLTVVQLGLSHFPLSTLHQRVTSFLSPLHIEKFTYPNHRLHHPVVPRLTLDLQLRARNSSRPPFSHVENFIGLPLIRSSKKEEVTFGEALSNLVPKWEATSDEATLRIDFRRVAVADAGALLPSVIRILETDARCTRFFHDECFELLMGGAEGVKLANAEVGRLEEDKRSRYRVLRAVLGREVV